MADSTTAFVSYSRDDLDFVLRLCRDLRAAGAAIWLDKLDIAPGEEWDQAVERGLSACGHLLIVLSPQSVASQNVLDEVGFALAREKRIVPVLFKDCEIPFRLARLQYVDARTDYDGADDWASERIYADIGRQDTSFAPATDGVDVGEAPAELADVEAADLLSDGRGAWIGTDYREGYSLPMAWSTSATGQTNDNPSLWTSGATVAMAALGDDYMNDWTWGATDIVPTSTGVKAIYYASKGSDTDIIIVSYSNDGSLDTSFGGDGVVRLGRPGLGEWVNGGVNLNDGNLLVAGTVEGTCSTWRISTTGALDTSWGTGGRAALPLAACQLTAEIGRAHV